MLVFCRVCSGQNLVPNGSFEDTVACAGWNPNNLPCLPWDSPTGGSPDYFSTVWASGCLQYTAPASAFGFQYAKDNNAYCGIMTYQGQLANIREYIQSPLLSPLINGHYYYASFYVSLADYETYACDRIGACITDSAIHKGGYNLIKRNPEIENTPGNVILDTLNWTLIDGYFYAQGGEQYITIGNFRTDSITIIDSLPWGTDLASYYFIDDVSVIDCTTTGIKENNAVQFKLLENPAKDFIEWITNEKIIDVCIYDMAGKLMKRKKYNQNTATYKLNVTDLKEGMYLLIIEGRNKKRGVKKFVKQ